MSFRIGCAVVLLSIVSIASAQESAEWYNNYVGFQTGVVTLSGTAYDGVSPSIGWSDASDSGLNLQVMLGHLFFPSFGAEFKMGYTNNAQGSSSLPDVTSSANFQTVNYSLNAKYFFQASKLTAKNFPYIGMGFVVLDSLSGSTRQSGQLVDEFDYGLQFLVGLNHRVNDHFSLNVEYTRISSLDLLDAYEYQHPADQNLFDVGVIYHY